MAGQQQLLARTCNLQSCITGDVVDLVWMPQRSIQCTWLHVCQAQKAAGSSYVQPF
jgi:hypothetical protein